MHYFVAAIATVPFLSYSWVARPRELLRVAMFLSKRSTFMASSVGTVTIYKCHRPVRTWVSVGNCDKSSLLFSSFLILSLIIPPFPFHRKKIQRELGLHEYASSNLPKCYFTCVCREPIWRWRLFFACSSSSSCSWSCSFSSSAARSLVLRANFCLVSSFRFSCTSASCATRELDSFVAVDALTSASSNCWLSESTSFWRGGRK